MQKLLALLILMALSLPCYSQLDLDENKFTSTYMILAPFAMKQCRYNGDSIGKDESSIACAYIKVVNELETQVIIEYVQFDTEDLKHLAEKYNSKRGDPIYFKISRNDFNNKCIRIYETWRPYLTFGSVIIPVKLRKNPFDFSKDFSLGPAIGFKLRISKVLPTYINLLYNVGVTSVTLNPDNAKTSTNETLNIAAFTQGVGIVAEVSNIQFGAFFGWDRLSYPQQNKYEWIYDKNRWISIGFGVSILSNQSKARISYRILEVSRKKSSKSSTIIFNYWKQSSTH
jgi:hypothetical protein